MFRGSDGRISSTKILSFIGYITFLVMSIVIFIVDSSKFDYQIFAILTGGGASAIKMYDKFLNKKDKNLLE